MSESLKRCAFALCGVVIGDLIFRAIRFRK
jgi:hypothetical protein